MSSISLGCHNSTSQLGIFIEKKKETQKTYFPLTNLFVSLAHIHTSYFRLLHIITLIKLKQVKQFHLPQSWVPLVFHWVLAQFLHF